MNTNDFGDVKTLAVLAQVAPAKIDMDATADATNANLVGAGSNYLHGVTLADFAVTCGNLTGVTLWAPVQDECSIGTLANNIDQTLFLDEVYVNSLEFSYTTGANATENYGAETDNKMWLLNGGRFVNFQEATISGSDVIAGYIELDLAASATVAELSTGIGFLRKDAKGATAISHYDASENTMTNVEVIQGVLADVGTAGYEEKYIYEPSATAATGKHTIYFPSATAFTPAVGDRLQFVYAADQYATPMNEYFVPIEEPTTRPNTVGALRQGQVEIYIVDPSDATATSFENAWRLTGATISANLTREPLAELGHLSPYDRPITLPIPITMTVNSTAGDLLNWARFAGKLSEYETFTLQDINISNLMNKDNLTLVVKVFEQTDEEAGGTGSNRKVLPGSSLDGDDYFNDGVLAQYSAPSREYALKTIIVKNLKITDEGMTLDLGSNATQTFGFKANNDLFVIKGDVSYDTVVGSLVRSA